MIRVSVRTRRRSTIICCICGARISVGDSYREMVAVQEADLFDVDFVRRVGHERCVSSDPCWMVTTQAELHRRAVDSLAFVRARYGLDVQPGQRCIALGQPGTVVEGRGKYVSVRLDGHRSAANYHARDIATA
jgi:hypothetical protein